MRQQQNQLLDQPLPNRLHLPLNGAPSPTRFMAGQALSFLEPSPLIRRRHCAVEVFTDNVLVTANNLLYADKNYSLKNIVSFQVVKLQRRTSTVHKKTVNLLGTVLITIGVILALGSAISWLRWVGGGVVLSSLAYLAAFYWRLLHRKIGEYGLLVHMQSGHSKVITSHSLRAIQNLLRALLQCLERPEETDNFWSVNMYTGDIYNQ